MQHFSFAEMLNFDFDLHEGPPIFRAIPILAFLCIIYILTKMWVRPAYPYPPGPKGYWYLGLPMSRVPMHKFWLTYIEWGKKYGDLIHYTRFGKHYLIINSLEAAREILDKQARFTSDRLNTPIDKISKMEKILGFIPYSDEWRITRKLFHQNYRAEACTQFHPIQTRQVERFIEKLISSGSKESLKDQISTLSQRIMFVTVYGLDISTSKEDMPDRARTFLEFHDFTIIPGWDGFKYIPFIHLLPSWFPLGGYLTAAHKAIGDLTHEAANAPWNACLNDMKSNENHSSLLSKLISESDLENHKELERLKYFGLQSIGAASDTTMSAICTFFLAMSLYPDVQYKAQQELDSVLGKGKTPTFEDRPSLPYVDAIFQEVMRWHPAVPMGLGHDSIKDIIYNGYYIPKGTSIYANIWAMTHDPSTFKDPDSFIPERHLHKDKKHDNINSILAYGFGRRVCVGKYMANDTIWLAIAYTLSRVTISSLPNENVEDYFSDGAFCSTKNLNCSVSPRILQ